MRGAGRTGTARPGGATLLVSFHPWNIKKGQKYYGVFTQSDLLDTYPPTYI